LYREEVEQHVDVILGEELKVQITDENPFDIAIQENHIERKNRIVSFVTDQEDDFH
jgi:hypothetical protein